MSVRALLVALLLCGCDGTAGDVLSVPAPAMPLGPTPLGCVDGGEDGTVCWYEAAWSAAAGRACAERGLVLAAHVAVGPCGPGFHRGVSCRCCPRPQRDPLIPPAPAPGSGKE